MSLGRTGLELHCLLKALDGFGPASGLGLEHA